MSAVGVARSPASTAEFLGTTQPSISKVLERLRTQFGDPLFTRSGNERQKRLRSRDRRTLLASADAATRPMTRTYMVKVPFPW